MRNFMFQEEVVYEVTGQGYYKGYYISETPVQKIFSSAVMIVSMLPIIAVYPFAQKYLMKGTMIGAIKG